MNLRQVDFLRFDTLAAICWLHDERAVPDALSLNKDAEKLAS